MFEPPDGTTDFDSDAADAERALEYRAAESRAAMFTIDSDDGEPDELRALELQQQALNARRAELERRRTEPQVIDSSGATVTPSEDAPAPWPHDVITVAGKSVEVKRPSAAAVRYLGVFGFGEAGAARGDFQDFMHRHVSPKSIDEIRGWTYAGEIDENFYDELMKTLIRVGTGRPTGRSSSSARTR